MTTATAPTPLTDRQREIFTYIWDRTCRDGFQPSYRDVMRHFGLASPNAVFNNVTALERKGWIKGQARTRAVRFLYTPSGDVFRGFRAIEDGEETP